MIEADVVERGRGREARDVAADVRVLVRAHAPSPSRSSARPSGSFARCSESPGMRTCWSTGIVLMYAVFAENGRNAPERRALSISRSIRKCARSGPSAASTPSSASSHSRVSCGSMSSCLSIASSSRAPILSRRRRLRIDATRGALRRGTRATYGNDAFPFVRRERCMSSISPARPLISAERRRSPAR